MCVTRVRDFVSPSRRAAGLACGFLALLLFAAPAAAVEIGGSFGIGAMHTDGDAGTSAVPAASASVELLGGGVAGLVLRFDVANVQPYAGRHESFVAGTLGPRLSWSSGPVRPYMGLGFGLAVGPSGLGGLVGSAGVGARVFLSPTLDGFADLTYQGTSDFSYDANSRQVRVGLTAWSRRRERP